MIIDTKGPILKTISKKYRALQNRYGKGALPKIFITYLAEQQMLKNKWKCWRSNEVLPPKLLESHIRYQPKLMIEKEFRKITPNTMYIYIYISCILFSNRGRCLPSFAYEMYDTIRWTTQTCHSGKLLLKDRWGIITSIIMNNQF